MVHRRFPPITLLAIMIIIGSISISIVDRLHHLLLILSCSLYEGSRWPTRNLPTMLMVLVLGGIRVIASLFHVSHGRWLRVIQEQVVLLK